MGFQSMFKNFKYKLQLNPWKRKTTTAYVLLWLALVLHTGRQPVISSWGFELSGQIYSKERLLRGDCERVSEKHEMQSSR